MVNWPSLQVHNDSLVPDSRPKEKTKKKQTNQIKYKRQQLIPEYASSEMHPLQKEETVETYKIVRQNKDNVGSLSGYGYPQ